MTTQEYEIHNLIVLIVPMRSRRVSVKCPA